MELYKNGDTLFTVYMDQVSNDCLLCDRWSGDVIGKSLLVDQNKWAQQVVNVDQNDIYQHEQNGLTNALIDDVNFYLKNAKGELSYVEQFEDMNMDRFTSPIDSNGIPEIVEIKIKLPRMKLIV
jgi:hypothetical protein